MNKKRCFTWVAILLLMPLWAFAASFPEKPTSEHFYVDEAGLIDAESGTRIDEAASALLAEERIPLYVVTISSLASYDAVTMRIEEYAADLFDHWGIGWQDRNYGILLLVSQGDRKARIELGADWGGGYDYQARQVMNELIIPAFKRGDYATGIADGVRGLDAMARGLALPKPKSPWWVFPAVAGGLVLVVIMIINLFRSGRKGWAWALLGVLGVILFFIIRAMLSSAGSGGGFGGGSSGGGGATGSW
ncbi:TPM domain-containing protein [Desulfoluna spongiiphila]|uniref:TPM domain-containing protein n=1 Tax=Desulfoluna spongiiphila TaxID=419481 RepID=UPI0012553702|nr:TPM domain-containing protein [Desulfoluna spongiiphila]VVS95626.1 tpm domain [Desulfoluna spongiiphila]